MVTLLPDEEEELLVPLRELHSLSEAHIPGAEFAQRPLREVQVVSLMIADPATWPKIVVTRTKEYGLIILDGYHRQEAGKRRRLAEIRATIRTFATVNEVIDAAFQANLHHGLPAGDKTRSDYAYWLFKTYPNLKQNEIAKRVGIKPSTVNTAIKRRERERKKAEAEQRYQWGQRKEDLERQAREEAEAQQLTQTIRSYVRQSRRLYERLRRLDDGACYWELDQVVTEGDKVMLARTCQYIEDYMKKNLPPDLMKSLKPTTTRTRRTKAPTNEDTETKHSEQEQ
jgi:transposase